MLTFPNGSISKLEDECLKLKLTCEESYCHTSHGEKKKKSIYFFPLTMSGFIPAQTALILSAHYRKGTW